MADSKISALSDGGALQAADELIVARGSSNNKIAGSQIMMTLFDSLLSGTAASIDTGASGIAAGFRSILVVILSQITTGTDFGQIDVTLNNDTGSNYDYQFVLGASTSAIASSLAAQTSWLLATAGSGNNYAGIAEILIPQYAATTFLKSGICKLCRPSTTAADQSTGTYSLGYRSTTAVSRLKVAAHTNDLAIGSRVTIYGIP